MKKVEKDVILKKEKTDLEKFLNERIEKNRNIFTREELSIIEKNNSLIKKVYILGIADSIF